VTAYKREGIHVLKGGHSDCQTASRPACQRQPGSSSKRKARPWPMAHGPWLMAHGSWIMDTTRTSTGQHRTEQSRTGRCTRSTPHHDCTQDTRRPAQDQPASNRLCSGAVGMDLAVPVPEPVPVPVRVPVCARTYTWSSSTMTWMLLGPRSYPLPFTAPTPPSTCTSTLHLHFRFASALSVAAAAAAAVAATAAVATAAAAAAKPTYLILPPLPLPLPLFPPSSRDGRRTPRPLTVRLVAHLSSRGEPVGSGVCNVVECAQHSIIEHPAPQHPSTPRSPKKKRFLIVSHAPRPWRPRV
jgi:hypothetical protein